MTSVKTRLAPSGETAIAAREEVPLVSAVRWADARSASQSCGMPSDVDAMESATRRLSGIQAKVGVPP